MPRAERAAALERWRADIDACYAGAPRASLRALTRHIHTFHLQREDFHAMIDGMAMDAAADICAPDEATLDLYCDRVASAAGRLSVRIFGMQEEPGRLLAHHLGRALQLTNILRDIDEDAGINRCYLPHELLAREGIAVTSPAADRRRPVAAARVRHARRRAPGAFRRSPTRSWTASRATTCARRASCRVCIACCSTARVERGFDMPRTKVSKPTLRLLWIVARYALF